MPESANRPYRVVWHVWECPICGAEVRLSGRAFGRRDLKTCGKQACGRALRLANDPGKGDRFRALVPKAAAARAASPKSGRFETNSSAKEWHLLGPDGTGYHFRNLSLWISRHADLFDPADVEMRPQASRGFCCRAQSRLGQLRPERRDRKVSWKGWQWLDEEEQ